MGRMIWELIPVKTLPGVKLYAKIVWFYMTRQRRKDEPIKD